MTDTVAETRNPPHDARHREADIRLPLGRLAVTGAGAALVSLIGWVAVSAAIGHGAQLGAGAAGAGLVLLVTLLSMIAMQPWKPRPVIEWTTWWLAALVGRFMVTPVLAYLLYSATPFDLTPLMLSVAATYVLVQLAEAVTLAAYLKRVI